MRKISWLLIMDSIQESLVAHWPIRPDPSKQTPKPITASSTSTKSCFLEWACITRNLSSRGDRLSLVYCFRILLPFIATPLWIMPPKKRKATQTKENGLIVFIAVWSNVTCKMRGVLIFHFLAHCQHDWSRVHRNFYCTAKAKKTKVEGGKGEQSEPQHSCQVRHLSFTA